MYKLKKDHRGNALYTLLCGVIEMELKTALEIKKAIILIEQELNVPVQKLGSLINLYNEDCYKKLQEASKLWNEFDRADIKERGKMLGYNIVNAT